ncbi:MAG: 2-succinyl-6-hydroxy-2,4-cyclohexadiene-1-carboxylate synthase [Gemmatimonadetes bacterium]|nr:2-succinyl-6-hydroxy-2,4-cyclohexadiene-1-carboxylate synthase [Gemmatimonadota bacterium]
MALILLHGFTGSSRAWGPAVIDALASAAGPPVLLDLPGHGRHAGDVAPWRFTFEAVEAEITALARGEAVDLVGYSMGGRFALAYAARNPERVGRLVLESASPGLETEEERAERRTADSALARLLETEGIEAFVDRWEALELFDSQHALPGEVRAAHRALRLRNDPRSLAASLRGLGTGDLPSYWGSLPQLRVPVLVLVGALDRKFATTGARMAQLLPDARLVEIAGAGHAVHLERPEAWIGAVTGFLTAGEGSA